MIFKLLFLPYWAAALLSPPQYISLMPSKAGATLEAENQIETLCPRETTKDLKACRAEKMKPQKWTLHLYQEPKVDSKKLGQIIVTATPGVGMIAEYIDDKKKVIPFASDSSGTDWGYSSYFEFTVSDVKEDWVQLPKRPFPQAVWVNLKKDWPLSGPYDFTPSPSPMNTESVYSVKALGDIVITKFEEKSIRYRKENPRDMPCGDDEPKSKLQLPPREMTAPLEKLYDSDGHLIAWIKYARGC